MKVSVKNLEDQICGEVELDPNVFDSPLRKDILHRVVEWQRAKKRAGTHKTKGISEISGTTKKPYKQKGTGSARQGSLRSPQYRGGAVIFGPVVRSHAHDLPKKVRKLGLRIAFSAKIRDSKLQIVEDLGLESSKTSHLLNKIKNIVGSSTLFIDTNTNNTNFLLAARNIGNINILPVQGANVYDVLKHQNIIMTRSAVEQLEERLK